MQKWVGKFIVVLGAATLSANIFAALVSPHTNAEYSAVPVGVETAATPLVMLTMTKGHVLWREAYNNYTDLNNDLIIDQTYNHDITYYGYFEPDRCYNYDTTNDLFVPKDISANKYCDGVTGFFSGNFLNWGTMTRLDIVRKMLYGGKRSTDTASSTVLERASLPSDAHSFAKWYGGDDIEKLVPWNETNDSLTSGTGINDGITLCNTTEPVAHGKSQTATNPPVVKMLRGNWSMWGASERVNCMYDDDVDDLGGGGLEKFTANGNDAAYTDINAETNSPANDNIAQVLQQGSDKLYNVRIKVCESERVASDVGVNCKAYGSSYKPIGLLQQYGEDGAIKFGLMTGSYLKNISGGVLRKAVADMTDEINTTNGTFKTPADNVGIIQTLDRLRIFGYNYGKFSGGGENHMFTYNDNWGDNCSWGKADITNGVCTSWGDPYSEIYLEALRYFGGLGATGDFAADDTTKAWSSGTWTAAPATDTWTSPVTASNSCAPLNIVGISAGVHSYDNDELGGFANLKAAVDPPAGVSHTAKSWTNKVGDFEGITNGKYLVGYASAGENDLFCTAKTITSFGDAHGICPFTPTQQGSYNVAGMAYYARTSDINSAVAGDQTVKTYGIDFGGDMPVINIPTPDGTKSVKITPAYRDLDNDSNGSLVNFYIAETHNVSEIDGEDTGKGKYIAVWEDGEFGGDYDLDIIGYIYYEITDDNITVWTDVIDESATGKHLFGFTIAGTTEDGFHAYSGVHETGDNAFYDDPYPDVQDCRSVDTHGCWTSQRNDHTGSGGDVRDMFHEFTLSDSGTLPVNTFFSPMYYAAKYGSFNDEDEDGLIDDVSDWDAVNNLTGVDGQDGVPDNYFSIRNPLGVVGALEKVFATIEREAAGAAEVSIGMSNFNGNGAVYHAFYESLKESGSESVQWIGHLNALWIDKAGHIREDSDSDGELDDYGTDKVMEIELSDGAPVIKRYSSSENDRFVPSGSSEVSVSQIKPLWSAVSELNGYTDAQLASNRNYISEKADNARYIFTAIPSAIGDNFVTSATVQAFDATFATTNFAYLNVATPLEATTVVNYVRGIEVAGTRNRTIGDTTYRLGDIINSSPVVVGAPAEAFDKMYGDTTYYDFYKHYKNRRQVLYVGSNDGMLHAFNAGFLEAGTETTKFSIDNEAGTAVKHPLGSELWAYVPTNVLPQVKWLANPSYEHTFFVDGNIKVFDAQIFSNDADHPHGWGTVLVAGMRLGGGEMTVNFGAGAAADDHTFRSSYMVFDITNPEKPPILLAEFNHEELGFTTSEPAVVHVENDPFDDAWYLVFGSGPFDTEANVASTLQQAHSTQNAKMFAWDLKARTAVLSKTDLGEATSHAGNPVTVDWDMDRKTDAIYVGTARRDNGTERSGNLYKINVGEDADIANWDAPVLFAETDGPVVARPTVALDEEDRHWVFVGSGRFAVPEDVLSINQEYQYGFIDTEQTTDYPLDDTLDVTDVTVSTTGDAGSLVYTVDGVDGVDDGSAFSALEGAVVGDLGWHRKLNYDGSTSSERIFHNAPLLGRILFSSSYQPEASECEDSGTSRVYGVCYTTGTPCDEANVFGDDRATDGGTDYSIEVDARISNVGVMIKSENEEYDINGISQTDCDSIKTAKPMGAIKLIANSADGELLQKSACTGGPLKTGVTSWREVLE